MDGCVFMFAFTQEFSCLCNFIHVLLFLYIYMKCMWLLYSTAAVIMWRMVFSNHPRSYLKCVVCCVFVCGYLLFFMSLTCFIKCFLFVVCVCVKVSVVEKRRRDRRFTVCTNNVEEKVWGVEIHLLCTEEYNHHSCSQTLISTHLLAHFLFT